jgi:hypothetical protein
MSGTQVSSFPDQNILFNAASGATGLALQHSQNQLLQDQQDISGHEMEMTSRLANTILDPTLYPTPEARAAAYPTLLANARASAPGYFKNAPATYPGDDVAHVFARMGTPSQTQAEWAQNLAANKAYSNANTPPAAPAAGGGVGTGGTNAPPGTSTPTAPQNLADIHPDLTQFRLPSGAGATVAKSAAPQFQGLLTDLEAAGYKLDPDTTGGYNPRNIAGTNTPSQHAYGLAMDVNWARNPRGANTQADIPPDLARSLAAKWGLTWGGDWQGADRDPMHFEVARGSGPGTDHPKGVATGWNANNPLNLTTDSGGVVTPGGARLANFASMADGVAATAAKLQSYQTDRGLNTVRQMYTEWHKGSAVNDADMQRIAGAMGVGVDQPFQLDPTKTAAWITAAQPGETGTAGKRLSQADIAAGVRQASAAPPVAPGTPASQAPYQTASNAPVPPPTPAAPGQAAPAPGQPAAAGGAASAQPPAPTVPPGGPAPPQLAQLNENGLTPIQQRQIDAMAANPQTKLHDRMAAQQGFVNQNIQLQQKQFSDWIQTQQLQTSQGQLTVAQQNSALEYWKAAHPDAKVTLTGGEIVTQNPRTGQEIAPRIQVTPQRADTAAMAIVSRLGPKVANGTATPEEQSQYAVAVDSYRQPTLRENPVTKETLRVNTRELPAGFPEPPSLGSGAPGTAGGGGGSQVVIPGYSPQQQEIERDPAKAKVADEQYGRDSKKIGDLTEGVTAAQNDNLRTKEMLDLLEKGDFSTGPGSETRTRAAAWFQRWAPAALSGWEKESATLTGAAAAQAFQKLAFQGVTTQEKESSPRGGILATQLFQRNNPGLDLLNPTNKSLLDMKLIQNQANIDYGRDALTHFTTQETRYGDTHKYSSQEQFNTKWINQRNPQVYAAAMGAVSGQPVEQWAKGLSDDGTQNSEYARVLQIVSRAKPGAVVNAKSGRIVVQPPAQPLPPGFTVVQ